MAVGGSHNSEIVLLSLLSCTWRRRARFALRRLSTSELFKIRPEHRAVGRAGSEAAGGAQPVIVVGAVDKIGHQLRDARKQIVWRVSRGIATCKDVPAKFIVTHVCRNRRPANTGRLADDPELVVAGEIIRAVFEH